jgi:DNA-binding NtrC family response regulator
MIVPSSARILIVDDDAAVLAGLEIVLGSAGYSVDRATSGAAALELLAEEPSDLVITDLQMPGIHGQELVSAMIGNWPDTPVVVLTAYGTVAQAVETMRLGAADYLVKPVDPADLLIRIARRLEDRAVREEARRLRLLISREAYGGIEGRDPKLLQIFEVIERVASAPFPVLIVGEPGTGKERIARAIHRRRIERLRERTGKPVDEAQFPFVGVNCGALSRTLLESSLFGHRKGAFTGAIADQEGVFVAAREGTLFLDEITELDIDLQVKLLRALQEREVTPLGSTMAVQIQALIITATNRPILDLVRRNEFRSDLFYRIHVVGIEVPPLRERRGDIPLLCESFLREIASRYGTPQKEIVPQVLDAFLAYPWPGNVRELQNVIEGAIALGSDETRILLEDIPAVVRGRGVVEVPHRVAGSTELGGFPTLDEAIAAHIRAALESSRWVRSRAAVLLGIDRNRLARLIRKYRIEPPRGWSRAS